MTNTLIQGDCLEVMKDIPDKSIDMILCDLPYGTTACKWDTIIPFEPLWEQYKRIIKDNGAIVLTAAQPFTSALVMSNPDMFKYEWIWDKVLAVGHLVSKKRPLSRHENICVFYKKTSLYKPQMVLRDKARKSKTKIGTKTFHCNFIQKKELKSILSHRFPTTILVESNSKRTGLHPTQKPLALFEYLIKTYTNEGDLVLDNCAGSGTTAIACMNTNRNYILIEKDPEYCEVIRKRILEHKQKLL